MSKAPLTLDDNSRVRIIMVGSESQGHKKDSGVIAALGEICAFVDDDAYPSREWLKNGARYFSDPEIGVVCGPGLTPPSDDLMQKAGGIIGASFIGVGPLRFDNIPTKAGFIDEGPGYNMLARRSLLLEVGMFATEFRSGEDTLLCQKIRRVGKKILYAPDVIVYHHRRPLFLPHLRQVENRGFHRGFFAKAFRSLSAKPIYFLPSSGLVTLTILFVLTLLEFLPFALLFMLSLIYLLACFTSGLRASGSLKVALLTLMGIPLTHLVYALGFLRGLLARELSQRASH